MKISKSLLKNNLRIIDLNNPKRIICEILEKDQNKIELFKELGFLESRNHHNNMYEKGKVFSILERK